MGRTTRIDRLQASEKAVGHICAAERKRRVVGEGDGVKVSRLDPGVQQALAGRVMRHLYRRQSGGHMRWFVTRRPQIVCDRDDFPVNDERRARTMKRGVDAEHPHDYLVGEGWRRSHAAAADGDRVFGYPHRTMTNGGVSGPCRRMRRQAETRMRVSVPPPSASIRERCAGYAHLAHTPRPGSRSDRCEGVIEPADVHTDDETARSKPTMCPHTRTPVLH